jgi:hypothetical protein
MSCDQAVDPDDFGCQAALSYYVPVLSHDRTYRSSFQIDDAGLTLRPYS